MLTCRVWIIASLLVGGCSQGGSEDSAQASKRTTEPSSTVTIERPPTLAEAQAAGAKCGVEVKYYDGIGRPAPWALYLPVDATADEEECYFSRIRKVLTEPTETSAQ
jgi:hypothetical protein